jgi:four helix bundle protein
MKTPIDKEKEPLFEFEKLDICQRSIELLDRICDLTEDVKTFTGRKIADQLIRASLSISLNIGEGFGSYYKNQKKRYFRIARGSIFESVIALQICKRRKIIQPDDFNELYQECFELSRMTSGLIKSIDRRSADVDKTGG